MGYSRIFFETGLTFLNSLIRFKLLNIIYILQSNSLLSKNGLNNNTLKYLKKVKLSQKININLNGDKLYKKYF